MDVQEQTEEFELSGGALCLDLANTVGDRPNFDREHLHEYGDLLRWSHQAGILDRRQVEALEHEARAYPHRARDVLKRGLELREAIYRQFSMLSRDEQPDEDDLQGLNKELHRALPNLRVESRQGDFDWVWDDSEPALERMLWPVARSAADLLTSEEARAVRECAAEACSWLFVDRSRSRRRRWCDMAVCGNRAKARRHYQRRKHDRSARGRDRIPKR